MARHPVKNVKWKTKVKTTANPEQTEQNLSIIVIEIDAKIAFDFPILHAVALDFHLKSEHTVEFFAKNTRFA